MRRLKTGRRPPIYPKTPGHLPCSSLTHPLPLPSRRPSVSFGGFGLRGNQISDISPLASLSNLTKLNLGGNEISDISPLASLTNLGALDLVNNQISEVSPLASLSNLASLNLRGNQISDISPLASLSNLTKLNLGGNQISDISPLASLPNLTELDLRENRISDLSPLVENLGLGGGDVVILQKNSLDLSEDSEDLENIRQLEARGVSVRHLP